MPTQYDNLGFGQLNPIEKKLIAPRGRSDADYFGQIFASTLNSIDGESILGNGPFKAICLRQEGPNGVKTSWLDRAVSVTTADTGTNQERVKIKARIPELHAMLPVPLEVGKEGDAQRINYYPTFVARDAGAFTPEPGTLVWVTFGNLENMSDPIYLGPVIEVAIPGVPGGSLEALYASIAGGLGAGGTGPFSYSSSAFGAHASNFGPADEEKFVTAKHRQALKFAIEEWKRFVGEPKKGAWEAISRYIGDPKCGNWKSKVPYLRNQQFEWCGAFLTCPFGAVGLKSVTVQSGLMSTYRIHARAKTTKAIQDKRKAKGKKYILPAGRLLNFKDIAPGDIVLVARGAEGAGITAGKHITMCWATPGQKDPMYEMGYRNGDFEKVNFEKYPEYSIAPTIPPGYIRTVEGNANGIGPKKEAGKFQGVITKLRHAQKQIVHIIRYKAEDFEDWPPPAQASVADTDAIVDEIEGADVSQPSA